MPRRIRGTHVQATTKRGRPSNHQIQGRRIALKALMLNGFDGAELDTRMLVAFPEMTSTGVRRLKRQLLSELKEQEDEISPHFRRLAMARTHGHIIKASQSGAWGAVISAEKFLADLQGTKEPKKVEVEVTETVHETVAHVLTNMSAERLEELLTNDPIALLDGKPRGDYIPPRPTAISPGLQHDTSDNQTPTVVQTVGESIDE